MKVKRISAVGNSCSFCNRGTLSKNGWVGLDYPYKTVISFENDGCGLSARICDDCLVELTEKVNNPTNE